MEGSNDKLSQVTAKLSDIKGENSGVGIEHGVGTVITKMAVSSAKQSHSSCTHNLSLLTQ